MTPEDTIMESWAKEAECEFREKGWKDASQNAVLMTVFNDLSRRIDRKIEKALAPLWILAGSVGTAALWMVVRGIFRF